MHLKETAVIKNIKLAARTPGQKTTIIDVNGVKVGQGLVIIAGPCSVETESQTIETAIAVKKAGAHICAAGRSSSDFSLCFQGLGLKGLKILDKARKENGLPVVTEVVDTRDVSWVGEYAHDLQIGARNMHNFSLLREAGKAGKPILLKRGMYSTLEEWLNCAEYILAEGKPNVILCARGIRTFETYTRNTLDLSMLPAVRRERHLPILIDPSHGTGLLPFIEPMSLAAVAAGTDGLEIEVHIDPASALSDKDQQLTIPMFESLMEKLRKLKAFFEESKMYVPGESPDNSTPETKFTLPSAFSEAVD